MVVAMVVAHGEGSFRRKKAAHRTHVHTYVHKHIHTYSGAGKSLARPGRKQATATEDFDVHDTYILFTIIIGRILVLLIYI